MVTFGGNQAIAVSDSADSDSINEIDYSDEEFESSKWDWEEIIDTAEPKLRVIDVKEFILLHQYEHCIDTSGADPTVRIRVYHPFDSCFLDSIGKFTGSGFQNFVGFEIPIKNLGLLSYRRKIGYTFSRRIQTPDPFNLNYYRELGHLIITPCHKIEKWYPVSLIIQRTDSLQTFDTLMLGEQRQLNNWKTPVVDYHPTPGIYKCIFELGLIDTLSERTRSINNLENRCDTIEIYDIVISKGDRTVISFCDYFDLYLLECADKRDNETCRFPWAGKDK